MSRRTVDAFVLSWSPKLNAYFAFCNVIPRDLILNSRFVPAGIDIMGRWIQVVVRDFNSVCEMVKLIDDVYESRVLDNNPEIRLRVTYDGKLGMFFNEYFGYICDTMNMIRNIESNETYLVWITRLHDRKIDSRWRISTKQKCILPNEDTNNQSPFRLLEAIVHSYSLDGNSYYAWSKLEPRSKIVINRSLCDSHRDLIGTWIDVKVNENNIAQKAPEIGQEVFKTRVKYGVMEVYVDFEVGISGMFYNSYFGNISDPREMVPFPEPDVWYQGWIMFYIKHGIDSRWRISKDQIMAPPVNKIPNSRSIINLPNVRETANQLFDHRDHNNITYRRNQDKNSHDREDYGTISRSPSSQNQRFQTCERKRFESNAVNSLEVSDVTTERRGNFLDNNTFEYDERSDSLSSVNHQFANLGNNSSSRSPKKENQLNQTNNEIPSVLHDSRQNFESQQLNQDPGQNKIFVDAEKVDKSMSESEYYTCSENEIEGSGTDFRNIRSTSRKKVTSFKANEKILQPSNGSKTSSRPIGHSELDVVKRSERNSEDRELLRLKSQLSQMNRLIESLTQDKYVSSQMKLLSPEKYEELMRLIKS